MSKYRALCKYLRNSGKEKIPLSFKEIEDIIGDVLPGSAYKYREWWANDLSHTQARNGWLCGGYRVEYVDLRRKQVTFTNVGIKHFLEDIHYSVEGYPEPHTSPMDSRAFEVLARKVMSEFLGVALKPFKKKDRPKKFDLVSPDYRIVGDAKYFSMVRGRKIPPAKFSNISEHVWLLEKIDADIKFLVFGNDIRVPLEWLKRYGKYIKEVRFYLIDKEGNVIPLR